MERHDLGFENGAVVQFLPPADRVGLPVINGGIHPQQGAIEVGRDDRALTSGVLQGGRAFALWQGREPAFDR